MNYKFKHVYVEITNTCQFNCSFCPKTTRKSKNLSLLEVTHILNEVKMYTTQVYLHILGEPLMHKDLQEIINVASKLGILVNITTNGYLLKDKIDILLSQNNIRKINISLHSMEDLTNKNKNLEDYLENIFFSTEKLVENNVTVIYRLWNSNLEYNKIITYIEKKYDTSISNSKSPQGGIKLTNKVFLSIDSIFEWPVNSNSENDGYCLGLKSHIAINSNGDVLPCCLDSEGLLKLGNIFDENLTSILNKDKTINIIEGFRKNKAIMPLCKKCSYKNRFN